MPAREQPTVATRPPRVTVLACDVLREEVEHLAADMPHILRSEYLPMGLHDQPDVLRSELRGWIALAENDPRTEAVVLIYGLCGNGTADLSTRRVPLVLPRAHDCITLYLGSAARYAAYQKAHPEAYFYTPGWMREKRTPGPDRAAKMRAELSERFDDREDVDYLMEMEEAVWAQHHRAAYIDLGLPNRADYPEKARACAASLKWDFEHLTGDVNLLRDTLAGRWSADRHLVLQPKEAIHPTHDGKIVRATKATPA